MTFKLKNPKKKKTPKISPRKLAFLIKDEKKASMEYKKLGFTELAKDEMKHHNYLKKIQTKKKD